MRLTHIVDIGCSPIDGIPSYQPMLEKGLCRVTGFEPQPDMLQQLNRNPSVNEIYLPDVVGTGHDAVLHVTQRAPGMTSLRTLNADTLRAFPYFELIARDRIEVPVKTRTLDDLLSGHPPDFIKLDVQGAELDVLSAAPLSVESAVAIQVEVSFIPLYVGQPTIGDIDAWMRKRDFVPHTFTDIKVWPIGPDTNVTSRQLLEADIVYVRDFTKPWTISSGQWRHLALLAEHCFKSPDLKLHAEQMLARDKAA